MTLTGASVQLKSNIFSFCVQASSHSSAAPLSIDLPDNLSELLMELSFYFLSVTHTLLMFTFSCNPFSWLYSFPCFMHLFPLCTVLQQCVCSCGLFLIHTLLIVLHSYFKANYTFHQVVVLSAFMRCSMNDWMEFHAIVSMLLQILM